MQWFSTSPEQQRLTENLLRDEMSLRHINFLTQEHSISFHCYVLGKLLRQADLESYSAASLIPSDTRLATATLMGLSEAKGSLTSTM